MARTRTNLPLLVLTDKNLTHSIQFLFLIISIWDENVNIISKQKSRNVAGSRLQSAAKWLIMTIHINEDISEEKTMYGNPCFV
jgi:hypothetical protein